MAGNWEELLLRSIAVQVFRNLATSEMANEVMSLIYSTL